MTGVLRIGGALVGALLAFVTGVWEVFLSPMHAGRTPLPIAPILAVVINLGLVWFVVTVTRTRALVVVAGAAWFAALVLGMTKTAEGDLAIPSTDGMGVLTVLLGAVAFGVAGYWMIMRNLMRGGNAAGSVSPRSAPAAPRPDADPRSAAAAPQSGASPRPAASAPRPGARPRSAAPGRPSGRGKR